MSLTYITEKDRDIIDGWYAKAKTIKNPDELSSFVDGLYNDYGHDYGTIVEACAASAVAAVNTVDYSPQGGITRFQAGCVVWRIMEQFMHLKGPAKLIRFEDMLYPQNSEKFEKTIPESGFIYLQKMAKERLADREWAMSPDVSAHMQSIVDGVVPFGYTIERG